MHETSVKIGRVVLEISVQTNETQTRSSQSACSTGRGGLVKPSFNFDNILQGNSKILLPDESLSSLYTFFASPIADGY